MTHSGPEYGHLGRLDGKDYIGGSQTYDNLRGKDNSFPLKVEWTDRFNQKHSVTLTSARDTCTLFFPCGPREINWYHGGGRDRTGFDALCTWCEVTFTHVDADWINNHGIRICFNGYASASTGFRDVDWNRVRSGLETGKSVAQIAKDLTEAGTNVYGGK